MIKFLKSTQYKKIHFNQKLNLKDMLSFEYKLNNLSLNNSSSSS